MHVYMAKASKKHDRKKEHFLGQKENHDQRSRLLTADICHVCHRQSDDHSIDAIRMISAGIEDDCFDAPPGDSQSILWIENSSTQSKNKSIGSERCVSRRSKRMCARL